MGLRFSLNARLPSSKSALRFARSISSLSALTASCSVWNGRSHNCRFITRNERGVLGRLAAEVTAADANIMHVTMHDDAVSTVSLHLTIQVDSRKHLAQVIRAIRHVPQVQKIVRVKG